jgi:hypothetical protein
VAKYIWIIIKKIKLKNYADNFGVYIGRLTNKIQNDKMSLYLGGK